MTRRGALAARTHDRGIMSRYRAVLSCVGSCYSVPLTCENGVRSSSPSGPVRLAVRAFVRSVVRDRGGSGRPTGVSRNACRRPPRTLVGASVRLLLRPPRARRRALRWRGVGRPHPLNADERLLLRQRPADACARASTRGSLVASRSRSQSRPNNRGWQPCLRTAAGTARRAATAGKRRATQPTPPPRQCNHTHSHEHQHTHL